MQYSRGYSEINVWLAGAMCFEYSTINIRTVHSFLTDFLVPAHSLSLSFPLYRLLSQSLSYKHKSTYQRNKNVFIIIHADYLIRTVHIHILQNVNILKTTTTTKQSDKFKPKTHTLADVIPS